MDRLFLCVCVFLLEFVSIAKRSHKGRRTGCPGGFPIKNVQFGLVVLRQLAKYVDERVDESSGQVHQTPFP